VITSLPLICLFLYGLAMVFFAPFGWFTRDWDYEWAQRIQGKPGDTECGFFTSSMVSLAG